MLNHLTRALLNPTMQLTRFTDFGLRVLMYLCAPAREQAVTVAEIAERFEVSRHHLNKVVQFLAQQGLVVANWGRVGGLAAACGLSAWLLTERTPLDPRADYPTCID